MGLVSASSIKDVTTRQVVQGLANKLDQDKAQTFAGLTLTNLTANQLVQTNADKALASVADLTTFISGTTNQISVTDEVGSVTLAIINPLKLSFDATSFITFTVDANGDLVIDSSDADYDLDFGDGKLLTTGTFGAGAITGTSLTDGEATLTGGLLTMDTAIATAIDIGGSYTGSQITLTGTSATDHAIEIDGVYSAALIYTHTSSATADTMLWGDMVSTATSGDFNGLRPRLTCNAASGGLNARAVYGEVIVGASKYAALTQGLLAHVSYAAGGCRITDIHALGVHISQGDSLTATNLYGIIVTIQTRGDETISGDDYMIRLDNEAVGGNGRQMDAAIQIVNTNMSGGIKGYGYGIDFSGGTFATAEIRLSNGETISNLVDGVIKLSGGGLWIDGTTGDTPTSGAGTRLMWIPSKYAFRAGVVTGTEWDAGSIGNYSAAMGRDAIASGSGSVAMGRDTIASGSYSAAMGRGTTASLSYAVAMGYNVIASGSGSVAMGQTVTASGSGSVAMGGGTVTGGTYSVAMGRYMQLTAAADYTFAFGYSASAISIVQPSTFFLYATTFQMCNATTGAAATDGLKISLSGGDATINNQDGDLAILAGGGDVTFGDADLSGIDLLTAHALRTSDEILATGTYELGWTEPDIGTGTRLLWYPRKAAFRAGHVAGTEWDNANIGVYSTAFNYYCTASGVSSLCGGSGGTASGQGATHLGGGGTASGDFATHLGGGGTASGTYSTHTGFTNLADCFGLVTLGQFSAATGGNATTWVAADPILVVGNGADADNRATVLTIYKNGNISTTGTLDAGAITGTSLDIDNINLNGNTLTATGDLTLVATGGDFDFSYDNIKNVGNLHVYYNAGIGTAAQSTTGLYAYHSCTMSAANNGIFSWARASGAWTGSYALKGLNFLAEARHTSGTGGVLYGVQGIAGQGSDIALATIYGGQFVARLDRTSSANGTVANVYGVKSDINFYSTAAGIMTNAYGVHSTVTTGTHGTIGTGYGLYTKLTEGASGTMTTGYGVYLDAPAGNIGTYYSIYSAGGDNIFAGDASIGTTTAPTAKLLLGAGTAAAGTAPLKFTAGTALTAAECGAVEFNDGRFYITNVAHRRAIDRTSDVAVETVTVANTTDETTLWTGTMAADSLVAGNVFMFHADGVVSNDSAGASDEVTIRIKVGGVTKVTLSPDTKQLTDTPWHIEANACQRTLGGTGARAMHMHLVIGDPITTGDEIRLIGVIEINTAASMDITVTAQWASADAANIISLYQGFMRYKN